jgi:hypothetical protein
MLTMTLPDALKHFIAKHGLFKRFTRNDSPGFVELWSIEDTPQQNAAIEMDVYARSFRAFAGNGSGEVLAINAASAVYMIP